MSWEKELIDKANEIIELYPEGLCKHKKNYF